MSKDKKKDFKGRKPAPSQKKSSKLPLILGVAGIAVLAAVLWMRSSSTPGTPPRGPDNYRVTLQTSKGDVVIDVTREWAPIGADRFHQLVKNGFYEEARFFRVLPRFVVQFGMKGDPAIDAQWNDAVIDDDPPTGHSNSPGTVTFATRGPGSRTTQVFINLGNNANLDSQGFTPFGRVVAGMDVVARFYASYGEGFPNGDGPDQNRIRTEGNAYLQQAFPNLDFIKKAIVQ